MVRASMLRDDDDLDDIPALCGVRGNVETRLPLSARAVINQPLDFAARQDGDHLLRIGGRRDAYQRVALTGAEFIFLLAQFLLFALQGSQLDAVGILRGFDLRVQFRPGRRAVRCVSRARGHTPARLGHTGR